MEKITVDSSVFVSSFLETDTFHKESAYFFQELQSREILIVEPIIVLLEILNVLTKTGKKDLSVVLRAFAGYHTLPVDQYMIEEAIFTFGKCHLKTSDNLVVWCASVSESTLISWDARLLREAGKLVVAKKPTEYMKEEGYNSQKSEHQ